MVDNGSMALKDKTVEYEEQGRNAPDMSGVAAERVGPDGSGSAETTIEVVPVGGVTSLTSVEDFLSSVRIVSDVAAGASLEVPVFRSPPRSPDLDRSIWRRPRSVVVSVRRRNRPVQAVQADLVEGVVVANDLEPLRASAFRRSAWSALAVNARRSIPDGASASRSSDAPSDAVAPAILSPDPADHGGTGRVADRQSRDPDVASVVDLAEHASAA